MGSYPGGPNERRCDDRKRDDNGDFRDDMEKILETSTCSEGGEGG